MTYQETLDYMYSQLPMFHRIGPAAYKANLDNTLALCKVLQHPENSFRSIHVAGTNGKGSVSHMLAAILQTAGFKVGLYTSPHLKDFRERIRINGTMISEEAVASFVSEYQPEFNKIKPSFFEMTVGMCFDYFRKEEVEIAVIETGLGGRLDSTNVITPLQSVITNIGYDHTALLGNSLEEIAYEKAGIIKQNVPVIIGETHPETEKIFRKVGNERHSSVFFADQLMKAENVEIKDGFMSVDIRCGGFTLYRNLKLDLTGTYQLKNVVTVLEAIEILKENDIRITEEVLFKGLKNVKSLTGLRGRWDIIGKSPLTICDTGHNIDGIKQVMKNIELTKYSQLHFVLGLVSDKDVEGILTLLPAEATYYFCKADIPRALDAKDLKSLAESHYLRGEAYSSVKNAMEAARKVALADDLVFVGGSTFVVGEAI